MATGDIFSSDFSGEPWWWQDAPLAGGAEEPLPEALDVAIVGSGYCGLSAALELARGGQRVAVLETGALGSGASSRNGGMVGGAIKPDWAGLARRYGEERAGALLDGARASFEHLEALIAGEQLDAAYERSGRVALCRHPAQLRTLEGELEALGPRAADVRILRSDALRAEIRSDHYCGGALIEMAGALHPARFHRSLRTAAADAGAQLCAHTAVRTIERAGPRFALTTDRGRLMADAVLVATNGYTGALTPDLRRRVIPVSSYMIATEELDEELTARLSPRGRMFVDENRLLAYFRLSPDRRRVLFGGRVNLASVDERTAARGLHQRMASVWPELKAVRISHAWKGYLAFTFDRLPHLGERDGVHFAMGCNGSGVAMATWLGHLSARRLLGRQDRPSPFEQLDFPTRPFYSGDPWFLPAVGAWYRLQDALDRWRPA